MVKSILSIQGEVIKKTTCQVIHMLLAQALKTLSKQKLPECIRNQVIPKYQGKIAKGVRPYVL